ncbi:TPA: hypothetical protein ACF9DN_002803 [Staphylococcus aureus]|uniref:hypothetical protein n=1 Tax=Staphylococcus saprophyticus TaxID=29385 RepID=UPI000E497D8C|nr:hypothetical protein [Staphylococcus aureus]HDH6438665.1 hypothetical protein [Staphylococcus aureus MRSA-Lux-28]MVJ15639.1 hypothetical protein [Staphylococcus aureus]HDE7320340.1 hypothetical protein [Staphylococcus aureus]HDF0017412.1 hypothetical protein [Staphylococcus aureus]
MNQNELGKQYQIYLLREFFSDKPLFNVPALTEEEQANMQEIKDNINPNVKIVIEESVQDATKSFAKLDSAVKNLHEVEEQMHDIEDIELKDKAYTPIENEVYSEYNKNKEAFNRMNQQYQIADIQTQEDIDSPSKHCYVSSIDNGTIELETDDAIYTVTIPHQEYLEMLENPNKYEFSLDKETEKIVYREATESIEMENDGLDRTPRFNKKQVEVENEDEYER